MALQSEVLCRGCPQRPGYTHVSRLPPRPSSGESARSLWGPRPAANAGQGEQHSRPWALGGVGWGGVGRPSHSLAAPAGGSQAEHSEQPPPEFTAPRSS